MLFSQLASTAQRSKYWFLITWLTFLIHYRKTLLGPFWLLIGPALFIALLGFLFSRIGQADPAIFIPHLTIGLIVWTLISGFVIGSATVFQRNRPQIMQGGMSLTDLVMVEVSTTVLQFLHQAILILIVFVIFQHGIGPYALISLVGFGLLIANGIWLTIVFGVIGARYRDLAEIVQALMRIAFLATPIIWMVGDNNSGGVLGLYLTFNPFYHFLEIFRAPLMGDPVASLSWLIVIVITVAGFASAQFLYVRFAHRVPLWI